MTGAISSETIALLAAIQGTLCLVAWPLFPDRRNMLLCQFGIAVGFTVHYGIIGVPTAALLNALGGIQVLASLALGERKGLRWIVWSMVPVIGLVCAISWTGLPSALATTGMMLVALGRTQTDPARLRLLVLAGMPFWLAHDLVVGSPLVIADAISGAVGLWAAMRHWHNARRPQGEKRPHPPFPDTLVSVSILRTRQGSRRAGQPPTPVLADRGRDVR